MSAAELTEQEWWAAAPERLDAAWAERDAHGPDPDTYAGDVAEELRRERNADAEVES